VGSVTPLLAGVSATPWSVLSGTRSRDAPYWLSHLARRRGEAPRTNDSTIWPPEMTIFSGLGFWKTTRTTSGFDSEAGRSWDCSRPRSTAQPCRIGQCIVVAFPPWRKLPAEHRRMTDLGQPGVCVVLCWSPFSFRQELHGPGIAPVPGDTGEQSGWWAMSPSCRNTRLPLGGQGVPSLGFNPSMPLRPCSCADKPALRSPEQGKRGAISPQQLVRRSPFCQSRRRRTKIVRSSCPASGMKAFRTHDPSSTHCLLNILVDERSMKVMVA
jgi:hypothetical protein